MAGRRLVLAGILLGTLAVVVVPHLLGGIGERSERPLANVAHRSIADLYALHFHGARHERMFLASLAFFATFGVTRAITHAIRAGRGPFHDVTTASGAHVHHLVWGILLLLGVGYLWLLEIGVGAGARGRSSTSTATALLFGAGAALTLDEFALWITFQDVYWQREGRLSIDAVLLFGSLLSVGLWGGPFLVDLVRLWTGAR
jgi:hypothetical protein